MTDCCNSIHGSTSSSDIASLRRANSRIRIARLVRPQSSSRRIVLGRGTSLYGFAIRGGREFGTGFFISSIESGSQADLKGLKVGDQLIRVNGYHVDDAVHRELSQFISNQDRITLKVRGIGMIPVKERSNDSLSWHIVPINNKQNPNEAGIEFSGNQDISIQLSVPPRTKLGLGICKGPVWKPGIYVQFTKDCGVAQQSGLRPGDQILYCNGISFADISFSDAVATMKSSYVLQLTVRAAAGLELFPGESSGYNSSASSITEEQIPSWIEQSSKRLTSLNSNNNNSNNNSNCNNNNNYNDNKDSEQFNQIRTKKSERLKMIAPPRIPNLQQPQQLTENKCNKNGSNTTIIKLSENGTVINNTLIPNITKNQITNCSIVRVEPNEHHIINTQRNDNKTQINFETKQNVNGIDHKIITVDVHRTGMGDMITSVPPPPPNQLNSQSSTLSRSTSLSSSSCDKSSLSSAIFEEVKRRAARTNSNEPSTNNSQFKNPPKIIGNSIADKNSEKHNALMDEFKKAHKKMFRNGFNEFGEPNNCNKERQTTAVNKSQGLNEGTGGIITTTTTANNNNINNNNNNNHDEVDNIKLNNNYIQLRNRIEYESSLSVVLNGSAGFRKSESDILSVPDTPIPDYDSTPSNTLTKVTNQNGLIVNKNEITKGTMGRVAASEIAKANGAAAEMESMESFKMTNPSSPIPKPPSVYFAPQSSGPATMKKSQRPVSVTIGEYGNLSDRRSAPAKFDFISRANVETKNEDVTTQLKNELEKTLSRSNLKKRTDIIDDKKLTNGNEKQTGIEMNKNTKTVLQKTQSGNFDKLSSILSQHHIKNNLNNNNNNSNNNSNNNNNNNNETTKVNRITISIPSKNESTSPNGILKTSITNIKTNTNGNAGEHKNIKFENI